jgi:hypothetical protein
VQEIPLSTIKGVRVTNFHQIKFDKSAGGGLLGGFERFLTSEGVQFKESERPSFEAFAEQVRAQLG